MATQAEIDALKAKETALFDQIRPLGIKAEELENAIARAEKLIQRARAAQARGETLLPAAQAQVDAATAELSGLQSQLSEIQSQLGPLRAERADLATQIVQLSKQLQPAPQPAPPATAAKTASDDAPQGPNAAPAQQVGANGRVVATPPETNPTTAESPTTSDTDAGTDTNTDVSVKTQEQTQTITSRSNSGQAVPTPDNQEAQEPTSVLKTGVAAKKDDEADTSTDTAQAEVNASNNTVLKITPQPNVLDRYFSYTYIASVYLMSDTQYQRLITGKNKKIDGYQLLFQSGGAPNNVGGVRPPPPTPPAAGSSGSSVAGAPSSNNIDGTLPDGGRNPFFNNDFYIDQITLTTVPAGKGTGAAHMNAELKFNVIEPMGITLIDRLYKAVENFSPRDATGKINYSSAVYLMTIRFYGYDENGELQMPIKGGLENDQSTSDPMAVVEKFIPFQIKSINWSIGSKLVNYEWDCVPIGQLQGGYTARGTIPYDVQLVDSTVGGLLAGSAKYAPTETSAANPGASTTVSADGRNAAGDPRRIDLPAAQSGAAPATPPKASAAPSSKKTITQGLMGAMNDFQEELVKKGVYDIPDYYEIEFLPGLGLDGKVIPATAISEAKLQLPNAKVDKAKTASGAPASQNGGKALDQARQSVDMISRSFSITAGQQILQAIELAIRNSSYITDQALVIINPDGTQQPNPNARNKPMTWFTITMSATKQPGGIDNKRNDNAYRIKYSVAPFIVKNFNSKYFPVSKFSGVHKSYPFWFTGKNTAVRDYQETLNALYTLTVSGDKPENSAAAKTANAFTSSMRDIVRYNYSPRSGESSHGADGKTFEVAANAAEVLYSPGDLAEAKVKIVGDPAWIMQGSLFKPVTEGTFTATSARSGFEPDGTVSFDSQDILFEVVWQRPEDYDLNTGLADPYSGGYSGNANGQREALQSRVYYCTKVVSEFRNGGFEQQLTGSLYLFPKTDLSNTANPQAAASDAATQENYSNEGRSSTPTSSATDRRRRSSGLTDAEANQKRAEFAARDPRRSDSADGGRAAILGSQQALTSGATKFAVNAGGAAFGNPNLTRQGVAGDAQLRTAETPRPANSDNGGTVNNVPATVAQGPERLPSGATPGDVRAALTAQRVANLRAQAAGQSPTSPTIPNNQQISREY